MGEPEGGTGLSGVLKSGPAVVLGAGGAARRSSVALATPAFPKSACSTGRRRGPNSSRPNSGGPIRVMPWEEREAALSGAALLVNTTTQGMGGEPALDLHLERLPTSALVTDIVYTPLHTPLLTAARRAAIPSWTVLACCSIRRGPASKPGSAGCRK